MTGHLEHLASIIRIGNECDEYGKPFSFAAVIRWLSPTEVEIMGIERAPKPSEWRAMGEILRNQGVLSVKFKRIKNNTKTLHLVSTAKG